VGLYINRLAVLRGAKPIHNTTPTLTENLNEHPIEVFMIKLVTMTSNQFLYMRELLDLDAKKLLISLSLVRDWLEDFK
jgi:hypothetical protein